MAKVREIWQKELAEWTETDPLAEEILDIMEEQLVEVTLEDAKTLWLDFLGTELHQGISNSLAALIDRGKIKAEPLPL